jgi:hypothetical protein
VTASEFAVGAVVVVLCAVIVALWVGLTAVRPVDDDDRKDGGR